MIAYLERMDRRDGRRMVGGFFRFLISLIPMALLIWSTWYFFVHSDEIIGKMTQAAAKQITGTSQNASGTVSDDMMNQIQQMQDALQKHRDAQQSSAQ